MVNKIDADMPALSEVILSLSKFMGQFFFFFMSGYRSFFVSVIPM